MISEGNSVLELVHPNSRELIVSSRLCVQGHHIGSLKLVSRGVSAHHGKWQMLLIRASSPTSSSSRWLNIYHCLSCLPVLTASDTLISVL